MKRAVARGLQRPALDVPRRLGVDEKSFAKRHEHVTVVKDIEADRAVHIADGRGKDAPAGFYDQFEATELKEFDVVAMDMHAPYVIATLYADPSAHAKIACDKFHVAMHLGDAVERVRRGEAKEPRELGDRSLVGTRYRWLTNPNEMSDRLRAAFESFRANTLKTARVGAQERSDGTLDAQAGPLDPGSMARLVRVGDPLATRSDQVGRSNDHATPHGRARRDPQAGKREGRGHHRNDPMG